MRTPKPTPGFSVVATVICLSLILISVSGVHSLVTIFQITKDMTSRNMQGESSLDDATIFDLSRVSAEEARLYRLEKTALENALDSLSSRETLVIQLRYGLDDGARYTPTEIGRQLDISRARVYQIQDEFLRRFCADVHTRFLWGNVKRAGDDDSSYSSSVVRR